eukprot:tig00021582_g22608.t1
MGLDEVEAIDRRRLPKPGEMNPFYGRQHSQESKSRISEAMKASWDEARRARLRATMSARWQSPEFRAKMSGPRTRSDQPRPLSPRKRGRKPKPRPLDAGPMAAGHAVATTASLGPPLRPSSPDGDEAPASPAAADDPSPAQLQRPPGAAGAGAGAEEAGPEGAGKLPGAGGVGASEREDLQRIQEIVTTEPFAEFDRALSRAPDPMDLVSRSLFQEPDERRRRRARRPALQPPVSEPPPGPRPETIGELLGIVQTSSGAILLPKPRLDGEASAATPGEAGAAALGPPREDGEPEAEAAAAAAVVGEEGIEEALCSGAAVIECGREGECGEQPWLAGEDEEEEEEDEVEDEEAALGSLSEGDWEGPAPGDEEGGRQRGRRSGRKKEAGGAVWSLGGRRIVEEPIEAPPHALFGASDTGLWPAPAGDEPPHVDAPHLTNRQRNLIRRRMLETQKVVQFCYLRRKLKLWSDAFSEQHGRLPSAEDIKEADIPGLWEQFEEYCSLRDAIRKDRR